MCRDCHPVNEADILTRTLETMRANQCATVPVLGAGQLVGLLTLENISEVLVVNAALGGNSQLTPDEHKHVMNNQHSIACFPMEIAPAPAIPTYIGGLGVAGARIAFALQEVIASLAGWFAVSVGNLHKTGDRVELEGIKGDAYNGRVVRVADSFVFKEPAVNDSGDFPFLSDEITVPVKYGSDRHLARELLQRVVHEVVGNYSAQAEDAWKVLVQKYLIEDASVEPMVTMVANDNWMEFTVRYTVDYKQRRTTRDRLSSRLLDEMDKTEGRVALASATFQLVEPPVFDVRLAPALPPREAASNLSQMNHRQTTDQP